MPVNLQRAKVFGFHYYPLESDLRGRPLFTQTHRYRDGHVLMDSMFALAQLGYEYDGPIANVSPKVLRRMEPHETRRCVPALRPGDLVYLPTRPPLNDPDPHDAPNLPKEGPRRYIERSDTPLERQIFRALRTVIRWCDRESLLLAIQLPEDARRFEQVFFRTNKGGRAKSMGPHWQPRQRPDHPQLTVGYLISIPSVEPIGFRLFAAFGPGGAETLILGQLLRKRWSSLLRELVVSDCPRVAIATFRVPEYLPYPYLAYDPDALDPRIAADVRLEAQAA